MLIIIKLALLFNETKNIVHTSYHQIIQESQIESKSYFIVKQALDEMVNDKIITILKEIESR